MTDRQQELIGQLQKRIAWILEVSQVLNDPGGDLKEQLLFLESQTWYLRRTITELKVELHES